jgi:hypothetical protein
MTTLVRGNSLRIARVAVIPSTSVHQDHIGAQLADELLRLLAVGGVADNFDILLQFEELAQSLAEQRVIVGQQDANLLPRDRGRCLFGGEGRFIQERH